MKATESVTGKLFTLALPISVYVSVGALGGQKKASDLILGFS